MSKETIKNLLIDFMADYDPNKWSNDDVYEKYAEKIDNVRSMGEIIAFTEITKKVKTLEAKLAESESKVKVGEFWHSAYQGKQLDYDKVYAELRQSYDENEKLKQQLAEKEKYTYTGKEVGEIEKNYESQIAEKEKECAVWERAYEYAIFECDFYKNHTQTTTEETMKRIEQLYEKILKRAKLLMGDK